MNFAPYPTAIEVWTLAVMGLVSLGLAHLLFWWWTR